MALFTLHRRKSAHSASLALSIVGLFLWGGVAIVDSIWSVYLDSFLHDISAVGLIGAGLALLSIAFYFFATPIIVRIPGAVLWQASVLAIIGTYYAISAGLFWLVIAAAIVVELAQVLQSETYGIIVKDASRRAELNQTMGIVYAFNNVGYLIGPLLATALLSRFGFPPAFWGAILFLVLALLSFRSIPLRRVDHHTRDAATVRDSLRNAREFFRSADRIRAYLIGGGVMAFWSVTFIFVPLFIVRSGLPGYWVGLFLAATSVPLIFLDYPIGKLADRHGCRRLFILGHLIIAGSAVAAFLSAGSIYGIMASFLVASVGASFLDSTRDSYFFSITRKSEEEKYFGPYSTAARTMGVVAMFAGSAVVAILPRQYLFLVLAALMVFFAWVSSTISASSPQTRTRPRPIA